jgi:hypothetical protein
MGKVPSKKFHVPSLRILVFNPGTLDLELGTNCK